MCEKGERFGRGLGPAGAHWALMVRTLHSAILMTFSATLPMRYFFTPVFPSVDITMRS